MLRMFEGFSGEYTYGVVGTAGVSGMYIFTFIRYCQFALQVIVSINSHINYV